MKHVRCLADGDCLELPVERGVQLGPEVGESEEVCGLHARDVAQQLLVAAVLAADADASADEQAHPHVACGGKDDEWRSRM